jgi:hypothetical protein
MSNDKKKKELAKVFAGRMVTNGQQMDAVRSVKGQIKGFLANDTMYRLRQAVEDHKNAGDEGYHPARLAIILALCDTYLARHGTETDARAREKLNLVEQIKAEAQAESSRRHAEAIYVRDVYAGAGKGVASDSKFVRETTGTISTATFETRQLVAGKTDPKNKEGFNQATLALIRKYGLTEGEVLAVKVYTADDYKYINPVMASDESRLITYMVPPKAADESEDSQEGSESESDQEFLKSLDLGDLPDLSLAEITATLALADLELSKLFEETMDLVDPKGKEPENPNHKRLADSKGKGPENPNHKSLADFKDVPENPKGKEPEFLKGVEHAKTEQASAYLRTQKGQDHLKQLFEEGALHGAMAVAALKKLPAREGLCYRGMRMTPAAFRQKYGQQTIEPETLRQVTSVATTKEAAEAFANGTGCQDPEKTVSVLTCVNVLTGRDIGDISVHGRKENEWLLLPGTVLEVDKVEERKGVEGDPPADTWVLVTAHEA